MLQYAVKVEKSRAANPAFFFISRTSAGLALIRFSACILDTLHPGRLTLACMYLSSPPAGSVCNFDNNSGLRLFAWPSGFFRGLAKSVLILHFMFRQAFVPAFGFSFGNGF
jgi:hypothetical protein